MKKRLLSLLALLCLFSNIAINAQHRLVLELKNGRTESWLLTERPEVTFEGSKMKISTSTIEYERSDVKQFSFSGPDALNEVSENELRFVQLGTDIQIFGLTDADKLIQVYDLGGRRAYAKVSIQSSLAHISLTELPQGIYIIKIGNKQSIKVKR